jgi:transcriptional regulator with XRE-family HTH domain
MEELAHWTQRSVADFVYNISSNFVAQLETRMEEKEISRSELAALLNKSNGRVSQVFNNPGNLSLRVIVEFARTLGMKVSIVAYDDGDAANDNGPINPEVFVKSWERAKRPRDLFDAAEVDARQALSNYIPISFQGGTEGYQLFSSGGVVKAMIPPKTNFFHEQIKTVIRGGFLPTNQPPYHEAQIQSQSRTY